MKDNYQWFIDKLKKEFPQGEIICNGFDMGFGFGVGIKIDNRRHAVMVKYIETEADEWAKVYDEDEEKWVEKAVHFKTVKEYDLNKDPDKEKQIEKIIKRFHEVLDK